MRHFETKEQRAISLLEKLTIEFPGLLDEETEVSGADLVELLTYELNDVKSKNLIAFLKGE